MGTIVALDDPAVVFRIGLRNSFVTDGADCGLYEGGNVSPRAASHHPSSFSSTVEHP